MHYGAFLGTVLLCLAPLVLLVASAFGAALGHVSVPPSIDTARMVLGSLVMLGALGIVVANRRLMSPGRPPPVGVAPKHISPIPFLGSILVGIGGVLGYGSVPLAVFGVALLALDPGGSLATLVTVVRDRRVLFGRR